MNENGKSLADFCVINELVIRVTILPHKPCHKATWRSPDGRTENQIDHITINRRWTSSLKNFRRRSLPRRRRKRRERGLEFYQGYVHLYIKTGKDVSGKVRGKEGYSS